MERRVLLAFFLSFLVLFAYQGLFMPTPEPAAETDGAGPAASVAPAAGTTGAPTPVTSPAVTPPVADVGAAASTEGMSAATPIVAAATPLKVVVDSETVRAVFSNRGAVLESWVLKQHAEQGRDVPVELIPQDLPPGEVRPFTLAFDDPSLGARVQAALFQPSASAVTVRDRAESLSFVFEDSTGLRVEKRFTFDPASPGYLVRVTIEATLAGRSLPVALQWGPALGGVESASGIGYRVGPRGVIYGRVEDGGVLGDQDIWRLEASDVVARPTYQGQLAFAGVDNHYFLAAALSETPGLQVGYRPVPLPPVEPDGAARDMMAFELRWNDGAIDDVPFFLGPKHFDTLEMVQPALIRAIDFGWSAWLVVPLHRSLTWIHDFIGNWGWAIIVLTVLINVIIFPLRHKSVVSMRKMQEIQPEMKAIQERYAHLKTTDPDKQKMNQEIMALYRERGVNPAAGCLPMLLTFPVLYAFYSLLSVTVEIRGEPFIGWINDLTIPDPLFITPLVMGVSMVVQQRLAPAQGDPMQQKIMMFMPVMFTGMFLWAPSGLVLYWLTSNLLGIGQTLVTNRVIGPPKVRTIRPAAERRTKARTPRGKRAKEK